MFEPSLGAPYDARRAGHSLAIARGIARAHGGDLETRDEDGALILKFPGIAV
jgi:hypothetical protein